MAVIAMTREMGTLGKDVAAGLAERLGLTVVHHELVEHVAERAGMRESEVHRFLEGESSLFDRWTIDSKRLSRYTAEEVLELALRGNVVIRGWGATYLLRSVPHVICVRICAPMSFREEVLKQRLRLLAARDRRDMSLIVIEAIELYEVKFGAAPVLASSRRSWRCKTNEQVMCGRADRCKKKAPL